MSTSTANERQLSFAHLRKIQIAKNQGESTSETGIFAVSVSTVKGASGQGDDDTVVLLLQVAVRSSLFSKGYTVSQICSDLKLDRNAILQQAAANDILKSSTSPPEVDHLVALLTSTTIPRDAVDAPGRLITFEFDNDSALRISVKELMASELVRLLWSTQIDDNGDGNSFDLALRLLQRQEDLAGQLECVKTQYRQLERDRDGWKDTAQALEGQWEEEKSVLFHNFCDLYKGKQDHEKQKVEGLQQENERLREELAEAKVSASSAKAGSTRPELAECLHNLHDDYDHDRFGAETVKLLAEGKPLPITPAHLAKKQARVTVNKETGKPASKRAKKETNLAAAKQKGTKHAEGAKAGSDSETGSDEEFVDKVMQAKILADLEALSK
jgi:hypothetical protein